MQYKVKVIEHTGDSFRRLILDAPEIARACVPGQFVHLLCTNPTNSNDPLLRRPFSIYDADPDNGKLSILYEVRGRGTALLAERQPGEEIDIIGPLGNGFNLPESDKEQIILVGGGVGAAPLYYLARVLTRQFGSECMGYVIGARTADLHVCHGDFISLCTSGEDVYGVCTDDGSMGHHGFVTELLVQRLESLGAETSPIIYTCGPTPMLKAVSKIAVERGLRCQVSTEAKMACGVGACMGCAIKVKDGDSSKYVRCCKEGPVFNADEIIWE